MITPQQASILAQLIEISTEGNWPSVTEQMLESGWTAREVASAAKELTDLADMSPLFDESDF